MERYAQSETYRPEYTEGHSGVSAVSFGVCRLTDGYWWDFVASAFQDANDNDSYQSMTEGSNGLWINTTGWAIPDADSQYKIQFKVTDGTGTFYPDGPKLVVAILGDILEDTGTTLPGTLSTIAGYVDNEITTIIGHLTDIKGAGWSDENLTTMDALIDSLVERLTAARAGYLDKLNVTGTLAHSDAAATYKATGFSTHSAADVKTAIEAAGSHLALILEDTGTTIPDLIAALNNISAADVNAQVSDVLKTDTSTMPGQEAPPATPTLEEAILYLYKFLRNKITTTATEVKVYADNESTVDHKSTISDDGTTFTRGEFGSGA